MRAIVFILANEGQEIVFNTDRGCGIASSTAFLQNDGSRSRCRERERESVSVRSQFLQQTVLMDRNDERINV